MKKDQDISVIRESFNSLSEVAPTNLWEKVLNELDENDVDELVKKSFSSIETGAPESAMTGLFANLNNPIDNIVKESFNEYTVGAPEGLWDKVDTQLETDLVWTKIEKEIKVYSQSWKTMIATAFITLLVSVLPNFLRDGTTVSNQIYAQNNSTVSTFEVKNKDVAAESHHLQEVTAGNNLILTEVSNLDADTEEIERLQNDLVNSDVNKLTNQNIDLLQGANLKFPNLEISKKVEKKKRFSIGVIAGLNRTWVIDNETRSSFEKNSLIESKLTLGSMIGLTAQYELGKNSFIAANYIVNATSRNKLAKFNNGVYEHKISEIKLSQLSIMYGRSFAIGQVPNWRLNAKLGPYVGLIRRSQVQEGETITSFNSDFRRVDYGLNLQVAPVYRVGQFEIETGINYEQGFRNIFAGNGYISSDLNYTNNTDLGIYISLRYRL